MVCPSEKAVRVLPLEAEIPKWINPFNHTRPPDDGQSDVFRIPRDRPTALTLQSPSRMGLD